MHCAPQVHPDGATGARPSPAVVALRATPQGIKGGTVAGDCASAFQITGGSHERRRHESKGAAQWQFNPRMYTLEPKPLEFQFKC